MFSAGICGVWTRVKQEAAEFVKLGHEVTIFSSNRMQGSDALAKCDETVDMIKIRRFWASKNILTRNVTFFNFDKEIEQLNPDIIITHTIHPHSFKALKYALKNSIPCYLVTHAPFNVKRRFPLNLLTSVYYALKVKPLLSKFTKIITITKWEIPYLQKLGIQKEKITYIPNGLPEEFFKQKKAKSDNDILFLGRISPIKYLETLIMAAKNLPKINFSVVGIAESDYMDELNKIISNEKVNNLKFYPPVYNLREKIKLIDEHKIFVLPSKREAMPQVLLEAMARGKIVLSSKTDGGKEIIHDGKDGFLFEIGDSAKLSELIKKNIRGNKNVSKNALKTAKNYSWNILIKKYSALFKSR